jgi:hypothetical protein
MKAFLEFIKEQTEPTENIDYVDSRFLENNLEKLNAELETGTARPYRNAPIMLAQMRGILERYGIQLPQSAQNQFLHLSSQLAYKLTDAQNLYIVYDTNTEGYVEGYAQVVTDEELSDLIKMKPADWMKNSPSPRRWVPPARKDDDSGNSGEY